MKILRIAYEWPPPWDGLGSAVYEITQAQIRIENEVTVFCGGLRKKPPLLRLQGQALRVYRFPRALKRFSVFLTTSPAILLGYVLYRLRNKVDVVHGHGHTTFWFNLYKLFFGWADKTPYVLHFHVTAAGREAKAKERDSKLDFWTKYFEWPLHKFSDRLGSRVANAVICTSQVVKEEAFEHYQADPEKVFIVENGVNTQLFEPCAKNKEQKTKNILYVGALNKRKNAHLLIEAMKLLPKEYQLTIVGRGDEDYQSLLKRQVEKHQLYDRVNFAGYVEYPKLPPYYQNADLFVLPSSYEGLPKVVLEALSCGVPVLASGFKLKEDIKGMHFLENLDAENIAVAIEKIIESEEKVDVEKIQQKYDWLVKAREIQRIYDRIRL